jgi:hypothetical protein
MIAIPNQTPPYAHSAISLAIDFLIIHRVIIGNPAYTKVTVVLKMKTSARTIMNCGMFSVMAMKNVTGKAFPNFYLAFLSLSLEVKPIKIIKV